MKSSARIIFALSAAIALQGLQTGLGVERIGNNRYEIVDCPFGGRNLNQRQRRKKARQNPHSKNKYQ